MAEVPREQRKMKRWRRRDLNTNLLQVRPGWALAPAWRLACGGASKDSIAMPHGLSKLPPPLCLQ